MFIQIRGFRSVFSVVLVFLAAGICDAATYYVGTNGSDSRSAAQAQNRSTPWRNIQHALYQVNGGGDQVVVLNGTYYENVSIQRSGYAGGDFVLRSENREGARIVGFIAAYDKSHITVQGFDLTNPSSSGITKGMVFGRCHHITVRNNRVRQCWGGGIAFDQTDFILVEWNITHENAYFDPTQHSGISVYQPQYRGSDSRTYGIHIRNNTSFANWNYVNNPNYGRPTDGNGIVFDDFFNSQSGGNGVRYDRLSMIENNVCFNNGGQGIHCYLSQNVRIRNNTCFNNVGSFDFGGEVAVVSCERVYVYNNILVARSGKKAALQYGSNNYWFGLNVIDGPTQDVPFDGSNHYGNPLFQPGTWIPESFSPAVDSGFDAGDHFFLDVNGRPRYNGPIDRGAIER